MRRIASVLLWSVIAAAFIGPGTVTTCGAAGAGHGAALLWALSFSAVACFVLQEASARVTLASGRTLGEALRPRRRGGVGAGWMAATAGAAILLGCAAYEAGNLLGAVAGVGLITALPRAAVALLLGAGAAALLWLGSTAAVVRVMSVLVAVMGVAFLYTAVRVAPAFGDLAVGALVPTVPQGAGVLVIALVGTTVVPYNLFLGSGIAGGQRRGEMRFGLAVAVGLGAVISMAIVVAGTAISGRFSYADLAAVLAARIGPWGRWLLAAGLFAAGFSSAITAPLAAAITARGLFAGSAAGWGERSWRWRGVWLAVLLCGVLFAATGVRPAPAIILAQALNGVLLPVVAVFLLLVVNDRRLMGGEGLNGAAANLLTALVCAVALVLGAAGVSRAAAAVLTLPVTVDRVALMVAAAVAVIAAPAVGTAVRRRRRSS